MLQKETYEGLLTYNLSAPGIDTADPHSGSPIYDDQPNTQIAVRFDPLLYQRNRSQGILALHYHNLLGSHAQAILLTPPPLARTAYLPIVSK